jgi:hypothetical protein
MRILKQLNILSGKKAKAGEVFESLFPNFLEVKYEKPSEYIKTYWTAYQQFCDGKAVNNNQNSRIFEYILAMLLVQENILPVFMNAQIAFVPNVKYDIILYSAESGPLCISAKTSLRERYKQADLEAIALKYVHRKSQSYLITNDAAEARSVNAKIKKGDVIGLDRVIYSFSEEMDAFIGNLKKMEFIKPKPIEIIKSNQVVTAEAVGRLRTP